MLFEQVLPLLKMNKKVYRKVWYPTDGSPVHSYIKLWNNSISDVIVNTNGGCTVIEYKPTVNDILADDWEIVTEH